MSTKISIFPGTVFVFCFGPPAESLEKRARASALTRVGWWMTQSDSNCSLRQPINCIWLSESSRATLAQHYESAISAMLNKERAERLLGSRVYANPAAGTSERK